MTRATRVHSTPPIRTTIDTTRRNLLAQAAAAVAGGALMGTALPLPDAAGAAVPLPDPVFAAIARHEQISVLYSAAVGRSSDMASTDPDFEEADGITGEATAALFEQIDVVFGFRPTTLAGVVALLRYIAKLEDWQAARGLEESESLRVVQELCTSIAAAIEHAEVRA